MKSSKLPIQSAPVQRDITGTAISSEHGVEASGFWDVAKKIGSVAAPILGSLI